jgi:tRNA threonylcarbamoyladenosine biosynthesis protein TsaB
VKTLALEMSSPCGSIAFLDGEEERFACEFANDRKHSGFFFEQLRLCLRKCGMPAQIIVGLGPGSYAGTRIALATATGLQVASGARLLGWPSLCAMPTEAEEYAVIGDARRSSFYFARVAGRQCVEGPVLLGQEELLQRVATLDGPVFSTEELVAFPGSAVAMPSARVLARLEALAHAGTTECPLQPIYLREPHITQPKVPLFPTRQ